MRGRGRERGLRAQGSGRALFRRRGTQKLGNACARPAAPTMLKRCGRRLLLGLAGALLACLLVLTADPPPVPVPAERSRRALHSLVPSALGLEAAAAPRELAREVHSLSEYFSLLTRARRNGPADSHPRTPAETLVLRDVFIAVKTTRKFHRARLDLLLETWISRHKEMVSPGCLARQVGWGARRPAQRQG